MPERIFITGIAGFLGSHLADTFLADGHEVFGVDSLIGGYEDNVPNGVDWLIGDCNEHEELVRFMREVRPGIVFHCAATAYEGLSVFSPHLVTQNIVGASVSVFSAAVATGVRRIVHCSSMARYGVGTPPFYERDEPKPIDPYGIGKLCAERMLENICSTHGLEWTIAVPHNIIGPRQKYDDPYRNVASIMINRTLQGQPIIIYGDGTQRRCFSPIEDCLDCLKKMAFQDDVRGQVINIGPDHGHISINDLANQVLLACRMNDWPAPQFMPGRPQEVKFAYCSSDKARELLGYEPKKLVSQTLRDMVDWIKQRGPKPFEYHLPLEIVNEKTPRTWKERLF